jgi:glycosyltransferase involved in cell wall biosynthesis
MNQPVKIEDKCKRIVILARSLEVGGAETQLVALAKGLAVTNREVTVACLYAHGPLLEGLTKAGIHVLPLEKKGRWDIFTFLFRASHTLQALKPDILHSFLTPPNILSALIRYSLRPCKIVWGVRASDMDLSNYDWTWRLTYRIEGVLSRLPDCIVANADAGRDHAIKQGFAAASMTVIPNGIDTGLYVKSKETGNKLREELGIENDAPLIGIIARLDPMKDHETFLNAARLLVDQIPNARFLSVGGGPPGKVSALKEMCRKLDLQDNVVWAGERRDLPAIYSALDITTLTSAYGEGFPNTLGEAMSCSVPCVSTDVGDTAKVIGRTGIVVPRGDAAEIAQGWTRLLAEPAAEREQRRLLSRQRIVQHFSLEALVNAHIHLYEKLCETTPTRSAN